MLCRIEYKNREEWLAGRNLRVGASEVAAILGLSPHINNVELWKVKTGRVKAKDLSDNVNVKYGVSAESVLRQLYAIDYPEYKIEYHAYDVLYQDDFPYLGVTLDAELTNIESGENGVWECKTAECTKKVQWAAWKEGVPQHYYIQIVAQLLATGWNFANLYAKLRGLNRDSQIRNYKFLRSERTEDIEYLREPIEKFAWHVKNDKQPPLILPMPEGWEE